MHEPVKDGCYESYETCQCFNMQIIQTQTDKFIHWWNLAVVTPSPWAEQPQKRGTRNPRNQSSSALPLIWHLCLPADWSDACVYLQRTEITVVVLDDLGRQVVEHVLLHASEDEGQDLAVQLLHGQGTCTANTTTSRSQPHSGLTVNSTDPFSQLTDPFVRLIHLLVRLTHSVS